MTQQNVLEWAKQGDAEAIASLMNRQLQDKGITVKTNLKSGCLMVIAESHQAPDKSFLIAYVRSGIKYLNSGAIQRVVLHARLVGEQTSVWRESFDIQTPLSSQDEISLPKSASTMHNVNSKNQNLTSEKLAMFSDALKQYRDILNVGFLSCILLLLIAHLLININKKPETVLWEYKVESIDDVLFESQMLRMGSEGWELASARRALSGEGSFRQGIYEVIFKRPVSESKLKK